MAHPLGRQPIGFNQPPGGGTNYPFVAPSSEIQYLLADLFVSFDDLDDQFTYPLQVAWLYGFGSNAVSPPSGYPTPQHDYDILITDADGVTVFNSTLADRFSEEDWDGRLKILEWVLDDRVLRCTTHTAWDQADLDDGQDQTYDDYIVPANGVLQADTWFKLPKRVRSLQVGLTTIEKSRVTLDEGYNLELEHLTEQATPTLDLTGISTSKPLVDGTRETNRIRLAAVPGSGLGVFPGCGDSELVLRTVNRVASNSHQNYTFDSEGCLRTQRPVGLVSQQPRRFDYASFDLTAQEAASAIELSNDCTACCDCESFARTYQGIKRQWFLYQDIATQAESARDTYATNRDRWLVQKAIREADTLRLRISVDGNCKISWGLAHCNASKCCLNNITVQLTWLYYINGILQAPVRAGYDCNKTKIDGSSQCSGPEPIVLESDGTGRHAYAYWDYSDPQTVTTLQGRNCFPDCADLEPEDLKVRLHAVVYWDSSGEHPNSGEDCEYPLLSEDDYPDDVLATWSALGISIPAGRAQKLTPMSEVSSDDPFCERCPCTEGEDASEG